MIGGDSMLRRRTRLVLRSPLILVLTVGMVLAELWPWEINRKFDDEYGLDVARRSLAEIRDLVKKAWG